MTQMYQLTGNTRLRGSLGTKTELVRKARAAGLVVASAWDDKTIPVYTDRARARADMSGERACALIQPVRAANANAIASRNAAPRFATYSLTSVVDAANDVDTTSVALHLIGIIATRRRRSFKSETETLEAFHALVLRLRNANFFVRTAIVKFTTMHKRRTAELPMNRSHMTQPTKAPRFYPPRKPGTVLVAMVEVPGGVAPMARIIERVPSIMRVRVVSPSGVQRPIEYSDLVLEDMPEATWSLAVRLAAARAGLDAAEGNAGRLAQLRAELISTEYMLGFRVV